MIEKADPELLACKAVMRVMEKIKGGRLTIISKPDKDERQRKAPDLLVRGSSLEYMIEHTRIESFQQQIRANQKYLELLKPLESELRGKLPTPGHFVLGIDPTSITGLKKRDAPRILEMLEQWALDKAPTLKIHTPITPRQHSIREVPPGLQFEVTLYRFPGLDGEFRIRALAPDEPELEEKRRERIQTALQAKCPKLYERCATGQVTVLVLESDDFQLANYGLIGQPVVEELSKRDDIPDEVYLVETVMEPEIVWILKYGNEWFPDYEHIGPHRVNEL